MKTAAGAWLLIIAATLGACANADRQGPQNATSGPAAPARLTFVADRTPWSYQGRPGWEIRTPSVTLRTTATDRRLTARLPDFLELAQAHRLTAIAPLRPPSQPLETYVLGTRSEWEAMTRGLLRDRARPYLRIERGGYSANGRGVYYNLGPRDTLVLAAHEGWHQFVQSAFADPLPVWLDEGLACYMEGFRWRADDPDRPEFLPWSNEERFDQLRRAAAADALMPLSDLVHARPQDLLDTDRGGAPALNYYAQCWALAHFLVESDAGARRPGLERLLRDAQGGRLIDAVDHAVGPREANVLRTRRTGAGVLTTYWNNEPIGAMNDAYRAFVRRIVATGGRDAAIAGRSPVSP